jgi:serine/threonine protein kinase
MNSCSSALDKSTGNKIAIKKVSRAFDDPVDAKRILREIKLMKKFSHENVGLRSLPPSLPPSLLLLILLLGPSTSRSLSSPSNNGRVRRYLYCLGMFSLHPLETLISYSTPNLRI